MSKLKTLTNKALSLALAFILCIVPILALGANAVSYPDGVTKEDCEAVVPKLDKVIPELVELTGKDLDQLVFSAIIQDSVLNGLFKSVYSELAGNTSTLSMMGVNITPASLAAATAAYPAVSAKIASCATIDDIIAASEKFTWGVNTKPGFAEAVAAMFTPFNSLLNVILCGGTAQINILLALKGDDGYSNAIVPLLNALSCPSIMSSADFAAAAAQNPNSMVKNIVLMLFSSIDAMIANPGNGLCSVLPCVAWYINEGKLSDSIKQLTDPLALRIGIITIPGIPALLSSIASLTGSGISASIGDIDISSLTGGSGDTVKLPEIDLAELAACGTVKDDVFTPDKAAALATVTRILVKTVKLNADKLTQDRPETAELIKPLTEKSDDELVKAFILLLCPDNSAYINPFEWTYREYTGASVSSTPNLTMDDYATVLEKIDPFLDEVAAESNPDNTIKTVITPVIYSNSLLGTLTSAVYSAIGTEKTAPLFSLLGIDVTPAGVAAAIAPAHPKAAAAIRSCSSWKDLNASSLDFGFVNGDAAGFEKALADILSPFAPILRYLLAEGSITVLGEIQLNGADGYNSAIIPLLEALDCPATSIKTYEQYKQSADTSAITDITAPIIALLDRICESPVKTLCSILPNIVYFINGEGLKNCISNLIYPLTAKLEKLGLADMIPADIIKTDDIDLSGTLEKLMSSSDIKLKLLTPDFSKVEKAGQKTTRISKRTAGGSETAYTYIEADSPAVLLTIFRYLVNTLSLEENADALSGLMSSMMSSSAKPEADTDSTAPDMMAMYAGSIGEKFKNMTTDEIIEWLYDLLFRETPKVEQSDDTDIPTIIYEKQKEKNPAAVTFIIILIVAVLFVLIYLLNKKGKFDNIKKRRKAKKENTGKRKDEKQKKTKKGRKKKKEQTKDNSPTETILPEAATADIAEPDKTAAEQPDNTNGENSAATDEAIADDATEHSYPESLLLPLSNDETAAQYTEATGEIKNAAAKSSGANKKALKLGKRQRKAEKQAIKQRRKADKYYKQAIKASIKQNNGGHK